MGGDDVKAGSKRGRSSRSHCRLAERVGNHPIRTAHSCATACGDFCSVTDDECNGDVTTVER